MKLNTLLTGMIAASAVLLSACSVNPVTGQNEINRTLAYGVGAAVTCGLIGAATKGSVGARNSALACGAIGAGAGAYMDHQEKLLRGKLANTQVQVQRVGDQIKLVMPDNITFPVNSSTLNSGAVRTLSEVSQVLAQYPDTTIFISGHTDSTGSRAINQPLSERRAASVANTFLNNGVASGRIQAQGFGSDRPIADNATEQGRAQNRRVEVQITPTN